MRQSKPAYNRFATLGCYLTRQNEIVERRIKEFTIVSWTLFIHATTMWPKAVTTMLWPFSFKAVRQRHNSLKMDEDEKTPYKKLSGVEFYICPTDYHTWICSAFVLEAPLQGGTAGIAECRGSHTKYVKNLYSHLSSQNLQTIWNYS